MMILGKGTIMGVSILLTYILIPQMHPDVTQPIIGCGIVALVSYLVATLFLSVFSFSATAILHAFILDEDQGGNAAAPECLEAFLDENDKPAPIRKKDENEME